MEVECYESSSGWKISFLSFMEQSAHYITVHKFFFNSNVFEMTSSYFYAISTHSNYCGYQFEVSHFLYFKELIYVLGLSFLIFVQYVVEICYIYINLLSFFRSYIHLEWSNELSLTRKILRIQNHISFNIHLIIYYHLNSLLSYSKMTRSSVISIFE